LFDVKVEKKERAREETQIRAKQESPKRPNNLFHDIPVGSKKKCKDITPLESMVDTSTKREERDKGFGRGRNGGGRDREGGQTSLDERDRLWNWVVWRVQIGRPRYSSFGWRGGNKTRKAVLQPSRLVEGDGIITHGALIWRNLRGDRQRQRAVGTTAPAATLAQQGRRVWESDKGNYPPPIGIRVFEKPPCHGLVLS